MYTCVCKVNPILVFIYIYIYVLCAVCIYICRGTYSDVFQQFGIYALLQSTLQVFVELQISIWIARHCKPCTQRRAPDRPSRTSAVGGPSRLLPVAITKVEGRYQVGSGSSYRYAYIYTHTYIHRYTYICTYTYTRIDR